MTQADVEGAQGKAHREVVDAQRQTGDQQPPGSLRTCRELAGQPTTQTATGAHIVLPVGEPCPGVACCCPGCWNRDTARYGLRHLVRCTSCAAALHGQVHQRQPPPGAARAVRRSAA